MHYVDFCYWLQGYVEMGGDVPNPKQWEMVKKHLALVFKKVTPSAWEDTQIHSGKSSAQVEDEAVDNAIEDAIKAMKRTDPIPHPSIVNLPYRPFDGKHTLTSLQDLSGLSWPTPYC